MKRAITAILLVTTLSACADGHRVEGMLEALGYRHIDIIGHAFLGCPDDYPYRTMFRAMNEEDAMITGTVCTGAFDQEPIITIR